VGGAHRDHGRHRPPPVFRSPTARRGRGGLRLDLGAHEHRRAALWGRRRRQQAARSLLGLRGGLPGRRHVPDDGDPRRRVGGNRGHVCAALHDRAGRRRSPHRVARGALLRSPDGGRQPAPARDEHGAADDAASDGLRPFNAAAAVGVVGTAPGRCGRVPAGCRGQRSAGHRRSRVARAALKPIARCRTVLGRDRRSPACRRIGSPADWLPHGFLALDRRKPVRIRLDQLDSKLGLGSRQGQSCSFLREHGGGVVRGDRVRSAHMARGAPRAPPGPSARPPRRAGRDWGPDRCCLAGRGDGRVDRRRPPLMALRWPPRCASSASN
jgi:hypothetical protein